MFGTRKAFNRSAITLSVMLIACAVVNGQLAPSQERITIEGFVYGANDGSLYFLKDLDAIEPRIPIVFASADLERYACLTNLDQRKIPCAVQILSVVKSHNAAGEIAFSKAYVVSHGGFQARMAKVSLFGWPPSP